MSEKRLTLNEAKEKFSKIHENGRDYGVRKAFDITIDDKPYIVYSIEGYEHENGKLNGTPATWWLDYSDYEPSEYYPEGNPRVLIPFVDKGCNRICFEINYKQRNSMKYKWDDYNLRRSGNCTIKANGKKIYFFTSYDLNHALAKAQTMIVTLMEHPFNFIRPEEEEGRKIWYYGLPAKVRNGYEAGEIKIDPDYSEIEHDKWWDLYDERSRPVLPPKTGSEKEDADMDGESRGESRDYGSINHGDALWDGMINWFRDDGE